MGWEKKKWVFSFTQPLLTILRAPILLRSLWVLQTSLIILLYSKTLAALRIFFSFYHEAEKSWSLKATYNIVTF